MATYEVVLRDDTVTRVVGADAYQQEGQLTTFFALEAGRRLVDAWSVRLASFRTAEVLVVRRTDAVDGPGAVGAGAAEVAGAAA